MSEKTIPKKLDVAVVVGSLRKASFSRKIANAMIEIAKPPLQLALVQYGDLTLFNEDHEKDPPASWVGFKKRIAAADAVLFVTPEYNRSIPGVLKNALDIGSRPEGKSVWDKKPGAVVSVTPYGLGGFGANHHLRQVLVYLNIPAMQQPEAYISKAGELFDADGNLQDASKREFFAKFLDAFTSRITKNAEK